MNITVYGNVKQKKNSYVIRQNRRTNKPFISKSKSLDEYSRDAIKQLMSSGVKVTDYPVSVNFTFFYGTKHRKDIDNSATTLLDCLTAAKVIEDDSVKYIKEVHVFFGGYDKENPRTEIVIENV